MSDYRFDFCIVSMQHDITFISYLTKQHFEYSRLLSGQGEKFSA